MAQKKFNSVEGFSVGIPGNVIDVVDSVANVYANRLFVQQYANLGDVGNIYIGGGLNNQVLKTDGSGNVYWALDTAPAGGNTTEVQFNTGGSLDGSSGLTFNKISNALTITGNITTGNASLGNLVTANYFSGNGSLFTSLTGGNVTGQVGNALVAGTVYSNAQPNITSVGALASLQISGTGNVYGANVVSANFVTGTLTTQDQPNITTVGILTTLNVSGNVTSGNALLGNAVTANYFVGNGSLLTGTVSNANYAAYAGNIINPEQSNITSVGELSSLTVSGLITATTTGIKVANIQDSSGTLTIQTQYNTNPGDVGITANLTVGSGGTGNLTVNGISDLGPVSNVKILGGSSNDVLITDGASGLSWTSQVANALIAGTVYIGNQPNITSVGTLVDANVDGNVLIGGNLTVNGNTYYTNVETLVIEDPIIEQGGGPNGDPLTSNDGKDRGSLLHYYTTKPVDAFMGWDNSAGEFGFGSNVSVSGEIVTFNQYGNLHAGHFIGDGSQLTGVIGTANNANYANFAGTVTTNAQPNITSVGTLASLSVTGLTTATGGIKVGNIQDTAGTNTISVASSTVGIIGNLTVGTGGTGNVTATYFIGNGSQLTDLPAGNRITNGTSNVAIASANSNITFGVNGTSNVVVVANTLVTINSNLSVTGSFTKDSKNVTTYVSSTTTPTNPTVGDQWYDQTNDITYQYIYDGVSYYWVDISSGYIDSNVNAVANTLVLRDANANIYGNYLVGSGLSVTGISNLGSISNVKITGGTNGYVIQTDGTGNLSFISAGSTGIAGANTQVQFNDGGSFGADANFTYNKGTDTLGVKNLSVESTGNITGGNLVSANFFTGTLTTASQPNITSVGTLADANINGNLLIGGNLIVNGTTQYTNVNNLYVKDPIIEMGGGANNAPLTTNDGKDRGTLLHYYTTNAIDAFMGWDNSNGEFAFGSNVSVSSEIITFNNFGNVRAGYFIGNGSLLTSITGGNITGQVANALVAGTVYTAAQPNITSVGTLTTANISGNVSSGGNIIGNGQYLTSINGSNVTGQVSNALVAGTVYSNAQPNITSVGILASLSVTANVSAGNILTNNLLYANGVAWNLGGTYSNSNVASYLPTYTGNFTAGNISTTGNITAAYFVGNGSTLTSITGGNVSGQVSNALVAGTVYSNAQPNITSVGILTSLSVTGNLSTGNINGGNAVVANYFVGNGSLLTGLPAGYSNANVAAYLPTYTGNVSAAYFIGDGSALTNINGSNVTGQVANALIAGTVYSNAQPNITSVGTLSNLIVSGNANVDGTLFANSIVGPSTANVTITAGVFVSTFDEFGNITLSDNVDVVNNLSAANVLTDNLLYANGVAWSFGSTYGNANVETFLPTYTGNFTAGNISTTGNITAAYFIGNGSQLTGLPAGYANSNVGAFLPTYTGIVGGTLSTNAQPNITSVGTLSELTVNGLTDLGGVGNLTITGGAAGYVLTTDGSGSLTWSAAGSGGGTSGFTSIVKDRFTTSGSSNTYTLSTTPGAKNDIEVIIDGLQQISNTYSLTGAVLSFPTNPTAGQIIEVTTFGTVDLSGNVGEVQFNNGGEFGSSDAFTFNTGTNTLSVANLITSGNITTQSGYLYVDNGIIAVSSGNAGVFNTSISNINLGLVANVTMGSTSGNVIARGTFNSNNAVINTVGVRNYYSTNDAITVTTDTIIDQFPVNSYRSAKYTMRVNSDDGYQAVEVLLVHNGASSYVTIYGSISSTGSDIVSLSSNIGSGNVRLFASTASTNTNVKILGTYVPD